GADCLPGLAGCRAEQMRIAFWSLPPGKPSSRVCWREVPKHLLQLRTKRQQFPLHSLATACTTARKPLNLLLRLARIIGRIYVDDAPGADGPRLGGKRRSFGSSADLLGRPIHRQLAFLNPLLRRAPLVVEPDDRPAGELQVGDDVFN